MFIPCWNRRKSEILLVVMDFDKDLIYIIDMERWNDIKFSPIVVFALLTCGVLVPVLFENDFAIALCMVPFYGYVFYKCHILGETLFPDFKSKKNVSRRFYINLLIIFVVDGVVSMLIGFNYVLFSLILNSVVSVIFAIVAIACIAWSDCDMSFPDRGTVFYWDDSF